LSENGIDAEMCGVIHGIARNKSIVSLNLSRNMTGIKPKYLPSIMEAIVQLLQVNIGKPFTCPFLVSPAQP
jgi:hypothetical protein